MNGAIDHPFRLCMVLLLGQLSRQNEPIPGVPSKVRGNVWTPSASQGEANVRENSADLWVFATKKTCFRSLLNVPCASK